MPIRNRFAELQNEISAIRQDFHQNPELLYETHRTAEVVANKLKSFGCDEVVTGIGKTGVIAVIKGKQNNSGRTIGLRADMDALPLAEDTGLPYASTVANKMHACGHDGHTAMLLGAGKYLAETRQFDGTVVLIFQPAEEGGAGAKAMLDDGLLKRWPIDEFYGLHNYPGIKLGDFAIKSGTITAATDNFDIEIEGKGGHAAKPNIAVDTGLVAAHIMVALQSVVSRNIDPIAQLVLSVTEMKTIGESYNVLPQKAVLKGTIRSMEEEVRAIAVERAHQLVEQTAKAFGAKAVFKRYKGYPTTINETESTKAAAAAATQVAGDCQLAEMVMGGEDFSYFLQERPGAFIFMGNGDSAPLHHPKYNFDDNAIPSGCSWFVEVVESRLLLK